jgi:hypothetical protein
MITKWLSTSELTLRINGVVYDLKYEDMKKRIKDSLLLLFSNIGQTSERKQ